MTASTLKVMPTLSEIIKITPTERALSVGRTGCGKTTLNRLLIRNWPFSFVIDPKGEIQLPKARVITDPRDLNRLKPEDPTPVMYRPKPEFDEDEIWDNVFRWLYERRNCSVYVDEINAVMTRGGRPPRYYKAILTRGRSLHIRCLSSTQRPFSIPMDVLDQSEHVMMFALQMKDGLKRMEELIGPTALRPLRNDHSFYYKDVRKSPSASRKWAEAIGIPPDKILDNGVVELMVSKESI